MTSIDYISRKLEQWDLSQKQEKYKYKIDPITKQYMKKLGKRRLNPKEWELVNEAKKMRRECINYVHKLNEKKDNKLEETNFIELTLDEDLTHVRLQYVQVNEDSIITDDFHDENFHYIDMWEDNILIPGHGEITTATKKYRDDGYNKRGLKKIGEKYSKVQKKTIPIYVGCGSTKNVVKLDSPKLNIKKFVKNTCNQIGCPVCFRSGRSSVARNLASDIRGKFEQIQKIGAPQDKKLVHATFSLDMEKYPFFDYDFLVNWFRSEIIVKFIKVFHRGLYPMVGFVLHPYRYKKYCFVCGEVNDGRAKKCCKCKSVGKWYLFHHAKGIHFHVITNFSPDFSDPLYKAYLKSQGFTYTNISLKSYNKKKVEFRNHPDNINIPWSDFLEKWSVFEYENAPFIRDELQLWRIIRYELGHAYWNPLKRTRSFFKDCYMRNKYYNINRKEEKEKYTVRVYSMDPVYRLAKNSEDRGFRYIKFIGEEYCEDLKFKEIYFSERKDGYKWLITTYRDTIARFKDKYKKTSRFK